MGINEKIIRDDSIDFYRYGIWAGEMDGFLFNSNDFLSRQAEAISIIERIMTQHGKKELLKSVVLLASIEHAIQEFDPWARDHVVHAFLSYLLGIYINEKFLRHNSLNVSPFQWKLAGLFHDVGYPAQIARKILKKYADQLNEIRENLSVDRPKFSFSTVPRGFDKLTRGIDAFDLIQRCLYGWGLDINARSEFGKMIEDGDVCHGMISGLSVLCVIDMMYQKYNPTRQYKSVREPENVSWNEWYFDHDVVPACAAIFIHNLPKRCFKKAKIDRFRAPLAYLLRLSDGLQDWERPSAHNRTGYPDDMFDIDVVGNDLIFKVENPIRMKAIKKELNSALIFSEINISS